MPVDWDELARRVQNAGAGALSSASSGGGSGASAPEPRVFFGTRKGTVPYRPTAAQGRPTFYGRTTPNYVEARSATPLRPGPDRDDVKGFSQALGEFYRWTDQQRDDWGNYLVSIGYIDEEDRDDYGTLLKAWNEVIEESSKFTEAGKKADPWAVARIIAGTDNEGGSAGGGRTRAGRERGFTGSRTATSSNTQVDLTDGATAKALVNSTLSKFLGRNATDEEIRSFTATLNQAEKANPITASTTTTDTFDDGVQTGSKSSTTTSGGLSAAGKAQTLEDDAVALPEYASYQAAGFYAPLLFQAIGATV